MKKVLILFIFLLILTGCKKSENNDEECNGRCEISFNMIEESERDF